MDEPRAVTAPFTSEAEPINLKPDNFFCVGIDVPGVGRSHGSDCCGGCLSTGDALTIASVLPETPVSAPVHLYVEREGMSPKQAQILAQLIFAARELARSRVSTRWHDERRCTHLCSECFTEMEYGTERVDHAPLCAVGRVDSLIDKLLALPKFKIKSQAKENAAGDEDLHAQDGNLAHGINGNYGAHSIGNAEGWAK